MPLNCKPPCIPFTCARPIRWPWRAFTAVLMACRWTRWQADMPAAARVARCRSAVARSSNWGLRSSCCTPMRPGRPCANGSGRRPRPHCLPTVQQAGQAGQGLPSHGAAPGGNLVAFPRPGGGAAPGPEAGLPAAMLQHFALRTPQLPQMLAFYTGQLGLVLSDLVRDPEGRLRACFLRSDPLHHALALFLAPMACFDHLSFEVPDWACMKTWGDHMARLREPIVWGLGRHGPGNDVFFMVRDPDGNLVEISSEIEHCGPGRAVGEWPHEERTLKRWGPAISRG